MGMEPKSLADLREEMRAVVRGEREAPPRPVVTTLFSMLTADVFELLSVLAATSALTVTELTERLGKAPSEVSRTVQRLAVLGIVRFVREGSEVRPELVSTQLKVDLVDRTVEPVPCGGSSSSPRA
jgi:predicted transcriptional regulator